MRGLLVPVLLASGCFSTNGAVRSRGGVLGGWTLAPVRCATSRSAVTSAVRLLFSNGVSISIIDDLVQGKHVVVAAGGASATLDGKSCRRFAPRADCDSQRNCSGALLIECDLWGGDLSADLTYELCPSL